MISNKLFFFLQRLLDSSFSECSKQHFRIQICICSSISFFSSTIFFSFSLLFQQPQTIAFFPGSRTTLYSGKHSFLSLRTQQPHSIFAITVTYKYFCLCRPYRSGTTNLTYKIQYCYSYRLMTTHNGHSRSISFRSSCDFLNYI